MVNKPAVAQISPIVLTASGNAISNGCELVAVHYVNTTSGVGQIDIYDGNETPGNRKITLGVAVVGGSDDFCPTQPMKFKNCVNVQFTTGTGFVTIVAN